MNVTTYPITPDPPPTMTDIQGLTAEEVDWLVLALQHCVLSVTSRPTPLRRPQAGLFLTRLVDRLRNPGA